MECWSTNCVKFQGTAEHISPWMLPINFVNGIVWEFQTMKNRASNNQQGHLSISGIICTVCMSHIKAYTCIQNLLSIVYRTNNIHNFTVLCLTVVVTLNMPHWSMSSITLYSKLGRFVMPRTWENLLGLVNSYPPDPWNLPGTDLLSGLQSCRGALQSTL